MTENAAIHVQNAPAITAPVPGPESRPVVREVVNLTEWIDLTARFTNLQEEIQDRQWKQAAVLAQVDRVFGESSISEFARECGISPGWAYKLLKLNEVFGEEPYAQDLSPSAHIVIAEKVKGPDPDTRRSKAREYASEAAGSGLSKSGTERLVSGKKDREDRKDRPRKHSCPLCDGSGEVTGEAFAEYRAMMRRMSPRRR